MERVESQLPTRGQRLVPGPLRRAHSPATRGLALDWEGRERPDRGAHGREQDPRRFLSAIDSLFAQGPLLADETQVVYVSPLRALSNDVQKNLQGPLAEIRALDPSLPELRVLVRSGDTAAADVVVTKPGSGIVTDAIAGRTRIVYTERGDFPEYPILVAEMACYLPSAHVSNEDLRAGRLGEAIRAVLEWPFPDRPRLDGAAVAARRLLDFY